MLQYLVRQCKRARQSKVGDFQQSLRIDQQIVWFEILQERQVISYLTFSSTHSVQNMREVQILQAAQRLRHHVFDMRWQKNDG